MKVQFRVGDRLGSLYDTSLAVAKSVKLKIRTNVYLDFKASREMLYRPYEEFADFLPMKGKLVLDVGSQYGDYAVLCAALYGARVIAFEPLSSNHARLLELLKRNNVEPMVKAERLGMSDFCRRVTMSYDGDMLSNLSTGRTNEDIQFTTLDDYIGPGDKVDILKVDVEGFELSVLRGGTRTLLRDKPKVILETHSTDLRSECDEFLCDLGYQKIHENGHRTHSRTGSELANLFYAHHEKMARIETA